MASYYDGKDEVIVLCPTRENAAGALGMVQSYYETIERVATEVILVVDSNDPQMDDYLAIPSKVQRRPDPPRIMVVEGGSLTKATNEAVARIWDTDCIIGHVGDDHRFRTKGWDNIIRDTILGGAAVCYAYDGFRSAWASAWWTTTKVIRTLGWLAVPGSMHLTIDDVFMDIGAGRDSLVFLPDVLIEHLHPAGGKVEWRPIVRSHYARDRRLQEEANLKRYRAEHFANDIAKLRSALGLPEKEQTDLSPGVTFRSRMTGRFKQLPDFALQVAPTKEELETFAGRPLVVSSPTWLKYRREWIKQWRVKAGVTGA